MNALQKELNWVEVEVTWHVLNACFFELFKRVLSDVTVLVKSCRDCNFWKLCNFKRVRRTQINKQAPIDCGQAFGCTMVFFEIHWEMLLLRMIS